MNNHFFILFWSGFTGKSAILNSRRPQGSSQRVAGKKRWTAFNCSSAFMLYLCLLFLLPSIADALCLPHIVSYLKLDEASNSIFSDESPNGIGGSCTNCPAVINGRIAKARLFSSASGSSIQIPFNSKLNWSIGKDFSIEFWMKHSTASPAIAEIIIGRLDDASQLRWQIGMRTSGQIFAEFTDEDGSGASSSVASANSLNDNQWHHIAFVRYDSDQENKLYVDGQLSNSIVVNYSAGFSSDTAGVDIGALDGGMFFNGVIDEVAIYSSYLTDSQILQNYNDGTVGLRWGYCGSADDVRIMPLGDSITKGSSLTITDPLLKVSYRQKLYLDLLDHDNDGLIDYYGDFVGRSANGQSALPVFDTDHEGQGGLTADQLAAQATLALQENSADVILLHAGTNDLDAGASAVDSTVSDVNLILTNIWNQVPSATVILAQIINRWPLDPNTTAFNEALGTMAEGRIANGDKLVLVDMESALTYPGDLDNSVSAVHPNPQGYLKMADKWYSTLSKILPPSNEAYPAITSDNSTKDATIGELFSFDVDSDGNPVPTFSFTISPSPDATIDPNSGLISWTPTATGLYDVTVKAENANGEDTFSFQIDVNSSNIGPNDTSGGGGGGCFISTINQ